MSFLLSAFASQLRPYRPLLLLAVVGGAWGLFAEVAHELREDRRQPGWLATTAWVGTRYLVMSSYLAELRRLWQQLRGSNS